MSIKTKGKTHKYILGNADVEGKGRATNLCEIEWELSEDGKFSMSAHAWNLNHTDIVWGGQCVDRIAAFFPEDKKAQEMAAIWEKYHLNDMRPGCEHQRAENWGKKELTIVTYVTKTRVFLLQKRAEEIACAAAARGEVAKLSKTAKMLVDPKFRVTKDTPKHLLRVDKVEKKLSTWVTEEVHPEGVLSKPCPVCGHKFGSAWLKEEIPQDVIDKIKSWDKE